MLAKNHVSDNVGGVKSFVSVTIRVGEADDQLKEITALPAALTRPTLGARSRHRILSGMTALKEAVNRELAKKGWTEVPSDGDVPIMAVGTTHERPTLRTFYDGFPGWRNKRESTGRCALMLFPYSSSNGPDFDDLSALASTPNLQCGLSVGWR